MESGLRMNDEAAGADEAVLTVGEGEGACLQGPKVASWRRWVFLAILGSYPPLLGLLGMRMAEASEETMLPSDFGSLLGMTISNLLVFAVFFGIAWAFYPLRLRDLFFRWKGKAWPVVWGIAYSVALRFGIAVVVMGLMLVVTLSNLLVAKDFGEEKQQEFVEQIKPDISHIVDVEAMAENPWVLFFYVTVISFVLAGFREELWRAGMIAGFEGLMGPKVSKHVERALVVLVIAVIFGIGHLPQGIGGVFLTGTLGLGLGLILIYHRSIWIATLAHGFFDATTFLLLYAVYRYFPDWLKGLLG